MGNAIGLKIAKIKESSLLKDLVFNHDKKICEFVYFITKLNKYYVENFRRNVTINEFTLCNVYTRKEYNVVIERVECGYFFEGLEYSFESMPNLDKVLYISYVAEDGPGFLSGVTGKRTILLGNVDKYFTELKEVEDEIKKMNAKFIFYNYEENSVKIINFEEYRDKNSNELRMGIELEVRNIKEIHFETKIPECTEYKFEDKLQKYEEMNFETLKNSSNTYTIENNSAYQTNYNSMEQKEMNIPVNDEELKHADESIENQGIVSLLPSKNIESSNSKEEEVSMLITESISFSSSNHENNMEIRSINVFKKETHIEPKCDHNADEKSNENSIHENLKEINLFNNNPKNLQMYTEPEGFQNKHLLIENDNLDSSDGFEYNQGIENFNSNKFNGNKKYQTMHINDNVLGSHYFISEEISSTDYKIDLKESISILNHTTPISNPNLLNSEKSSFKSPLLLPAKEDTEIKLKSNEVTRNLKKCKKKYQKKLSVYEKIDSNYNFMTINKVPLSLIETAITTPDRIKYENLDKSQKPIKKKVLIKGYYLNKNYDSSLQNNFTNLKILDLHQNTKNILLNNSQSFI